MYDAFHTSETGSSGLCESLIEDVLCTRYLLSLGGTYTAYIAGILSSHYVDKLRLSQLCIARTDSLVLVNIYR